MNDNVKQRTERKVKREKLLERQRYNDKYYKEEIITQGAFVVGRNKVLKNEVEMNEIELLTLIAKSKRPVYSDEEIGKMFRAIFQK